MASRRQFLIGAGALAASTALPLPVIATPATEAVQAPRLLAFVAGSAGEFDWKPFFAATEAEARQMARRWFGYDDGDAESEWFEFQRVPKWDKRGDAKSVTPADWIRADMGHTCSRCDGETYGGEGGFAIGDEAICEECLTLKERLGLRWPDDAIDEIADHIADHGEAATREWLIAEGAWEAAAPHWAKAVEQAAS